MDDWTGPASGCPRRGMEDHPVRSARHNHRNRARRVTAPGGFTLIEASLATVIIGVGVLAMVDAQSSFIVSNQWSSHAATATFLANEIREMTRSLPKHDPVVGLFLEDQGDGTTTLLGWGPEQGETTLADFDDIDDFDGVVFSWIGTPDLVNGDLPGPVNAFREVIPGLTIEGQETEETMLGWTQTVIVRKVHPFDFSQELANDFAELPSGAFPGRTVDQYPLRVTVQVHYQSLSQIEASLIAEVTWIVP